MNILHISRHFLPIIGGTETVIKEIAKRQVKMGHSVQVLCANRDLTKKNGNLFSSLEEIDGININRINVIGNYKKPLPFISELRRVKNLLKWADIVHLHDIRFLLETTIVFKKIYNYKLFLSTHGLFFHNPEFTFFKKMLLNSYYIPIFKSSFDKIIAVSERDADILRKLSKSKKITLIENGIDIEKFTIKKNPIKGNFIYFGRIDKNKGLEYLFRILSSLNINIKWKLNIVGTGQETYVRKLKSMAYRLKINENITWWGKVEDKFLLELLSKAHIAFFPSIDEGFGLTLVEALSTGTICVANNIYSYKGIIQKLKAGYIIDFKETEKSVRFIENLIKSDKLIENKINKEILQTYDWDYKVEKLLAVYCENS